MIFVMKFQVAAMSRANVDEADRPDFCLYVDEFQNFSTDSFATIMSEARKYHLNLIVANQFTTQLSEEIRDAVFGNMGTIVAFRVGQNDVEALSRYFKPIFEADDLLRVPNYNAIVRTLINGVPTQPFSMISLPPLGNPNPKLGDALKQLSAAKFGKPRAVVDAEITERMKTLAPPKPAFGSANPFGAPPAGGAPGYGMPPTGAPASGSPRPPAGGSSFLDDWLSKRQSGPGQSVAVPPAGMPPAMANRSPFTPAPQPFAAQPAAPPPPAPFQPAVQPRPPVPAPAPPPAPQPAAPAPAPPSGEINLKTAGDSADPEDTIYIDREGNFTQN
jgi:hypothetical protein